MPTYQTRNPLARTNPLRSIPFLRVAPVARSPMDVAVWELDRAQAVMPNLEQQYVHARQCLGNANRQPCVCRRRFQSQAMRFLNQARAQLRAGRARVAKAEAAMADLQAQPTLPFVMAA